VLGLYKRAAITAEAELLPKQETGGKSRVKVGPREIKWLTIVPLQKNLWYHFVTEES